MQKTKTGREGNGSDTVQAAGEEEKGGGGGRTSLEAAVMAD